MEVMSKNLFLVPIVIISDGCSKCLNVIIFSKNAMQSYKKA